MFNNNVHRYSDDKVMVPLEVSLINMTLMHWCNPCLDLVNFMFTSTTPQLRKSHLDEILSCYHDEFIKKIQMLGEDPSIYSFR